MVQGLYANELRKNKNENLYFSQRAKFKGQKSQNSQPNLERFRDYEIIESAIIKAI